MSVIKGFETESFPARKGEMVWKDYLAWFKSTYCKKEKIREVGVILMIALNIKRQDIKDGKVLRVDDFSIRKIIKYCERLLKSIEK